MALNRTKLRIAQQVEVYIISILNLEILDLTLLSLSFAIPWRSNYKIKQNEHSFEVCKVEN